MLLWSFTLANSFLKFIQSLFVVQPQTYIIEADLLAQPATLAANSLLNLKPRFSQGNSSKTKLFCPKLDLSKSVFHSPKDLLILPSNCSSFKFLLFQNILYAKQTGPKKFSYRLTCFLGHRQNQSKSTKNFVFFYWIFSVDQLRYQPKACLSCLVTQLLKRWKMQRTCFFLYNRNSVCEDDLGWFQYLKSLPASSDSFWGETIALNSVL